MSSDEIEVVDSSNELNFKSTLQPYEVMLKLYDQEYDQKIELDQTDSFATGSLDTDIKINRLRGVYDIFSSKLYDEILLPQPAKFIGATETWDEIKNYYARILNIDENKVEVDCLIDEIEKDFQKRIFNKHLFENIGSLEVGTYVLIKIFLKKGKSMITVRDAEKLVKKSLFEDYSEFDDLYEITTKESTLTKL